MAMTHEAMFPMDAFKGFVICWDVTGGNFLVRKRIAQLCRDRSLSGEKITTGEKRKKIFIFLL